MRTTNEVQSEGDRGSALVMAVFVLALLTGMGTALLFLSQHETRMGRANLRATRAFYLAEAGLEDSRATLFAVNTDENFNNDLDAAAGADDVIDFDPDAIQVTYDSNGNVTGFTGFNDDVPVRAWTSLTDASSGETGWYAAFLTNDPIDGRTNQTDSNGRVILTGVGAGAGRSLEAVEAVVEPWRFVPDAPAAAITMLGPLPSFDNGNSGTQSHVGEDCGVSGGPYAPIVGGVNPAAANQIKADMRRPSTFHSGPFSGQDTVGNLTNPADPIVAGAGHGTIDSGWLDCIALKEMVIKLSIYADYYCNTDLGSCSIPSTAAPDDVVVIDGDLANSPSGAHTGILLVTGQLTYRGTTGWNGMVMAIGEGNILRSGGGTFKPSGGIVIANIDPTPNGPRADKSDWCTGGGDGFARATYDTTGGGNSEVQWCNTDSSNANSVRSYRVVEFLQH